MQFTYLAVAIFLPALAAAQACGAPQCDDTTGYLCGVCDPEDPQICTVGGTQHVCKENVYGLGGGSCITACYYNNVEGTGAVPYTECC